MLILLSSSLNLKSLVSHLARWNLRFVWGMFGSGVSSEEMLVSDPPRKKKKYVKIITKTSTTAATIPMISFELLFSSGAMLYVYTL